MKKHLIFLDANPDDVKEHVVNTLTESVKSEVRKQLLERGYLDKEVEVDITDQLPKPMKSRQWSEKAGEKLKEDYKFLKAHGNISFTEEEFLADNLPSAQTKAITESFREKWAGEAATVNRSRWLREAKEEYAELRAQGFLTNTTAEEYTAYYFQEQQRLAAHA